ncbi:MAG: TetR/AcrR family transcriptional regulator [Rhizobiaceae bacterium]
MNAASAKAKRSVKEYLDASERERRILEAAIAFVADRGLSFSTRELADHLGISQPLLYRYFANKEALVERIYDEVYLKRWNPQWNVNLADRSRPVSDRLTEYLSDYTRTILDEHWIRIFIASALEDPKISRRYLKMLHETTFPLIFEEVGAEIGVEVPKTDSIRALAHEVVWGFHSSFFYLGVRKYIYRTELPENLEDVMRARVDVFVAGLQATMPSLIERFSVVEQPQTSDEELARS